jgi:protein-L-isoaspartate(D-aspartate) O-methyltransferase
VGNRKRGLRCTSGWLGGAPIGNRRYGRLQTCATAAYAAQVNLVLRCLAWWSITAGTILVAEAQLEMPEFLSARERMVEQLREDEGFGDARVLAAMRETPRHPFVPKRLRAMAYYDMALPIGRGQTISPPSMVARMIDRLDPQPGDRVLEVGTGTGYQAAVLSRMATEVCTIEIVGSLARQARSTLKRLGRVNVRVKTGDGYLGWPERAPFDRIIVACSPEQVPAPLIEQLKEGGKLVVPLGAGYDQMLYVLTKTNGVLVREAVAPTVFVPMRGRAEAEREHPVGSSVPALINASFEEVLPGTLRPRGWYHQRQMTVPIGEAPDEARCALFENASPGRTAEASQAFGLDGRRVRELAVAGMVKADAIEAGPGEREQASVVLAFYNGKRELIGARSVADWQGTFGWRSFQGRVTVPSATREAIVRVGLCGATGRLALDELRLTVLD